MLTEVIQLLCADVRCELLLLLNAPAEKLVHWLTLFRRLRYFDVHAMHVSLIYSFFAPFIWLTRPFVSAVWLRRTADSSNPAGLSKKVADNVVAGRQGRNESYVARSGLVWPMNFSIS